ncbi:hypothetical protein V6N13_131014 [Hibiscus sabdariffa]|uniref:Protein kinase domain-containing protein n=2 Tax=Hibiscus sabdariffa TaxID=183260 RepID=A0ABR1ZIN3_9ROSI
MFACLKGKRHQNNQTIFRKNGGALLEELVAFCDGRSNPIRHFSAEELLRATNYYANNQIIVQDAGYLLYEGSLKERPIFVKQYVTNFPGPWSEHFAYRDIVIGLQMSAHKNVLKVIGCCLETQKPSVVYEFTGKQILSQRIFATNVESVLPLKCRLRIAVDLANAVTYLHTAFSRPVVHRDIKCSNILLDHNNVPKLIDFGLCISIPQGQSHVEDAVLGRMGYSAPEYTVSGYLTEKADVYSFGILLLELLSGRRPTDVIMVHNVLHDDDQHRVEIFSKVVDPRISIEEEQLQDLATLFARCTCDDGVKRPAMIEVAKELKRILQSCL